MLGCCTRARNGSNSNLGLKKKVKSKCWLMVQNKATCHEKKIQVINYLRIATASISKFILHVPGGVDGINLVCRDGAGDRLRHLAIVGDVSNAQSLACRCSASNGRPWFAPQHQAAMATDAGGRWLYLFRPLRQGRISRQGYGSHDGFDMYSTRFTNTPAAAAG